MNEAFKTRTSEGRCDKCGAGVAWRGYDGSLDAYYYCARGCEGGARESVERKKAVTRRDQCESALAGVDDPAAFVAKVREAVTLSCDAMTDGDTCEPTAYWTAIQACKHLSKMLPATPKENDDG